MRSRKMLKAAFCGCLQNGDFSDEEQTNIKEKKSEKKKNEKVDTRKLGSYMTLWKDKSSQNKKDIEIIFDLLQNQIQEFEASVIKGSEKQHYIITNDLKVLYYNVQNQYLVKEDMIKSHHIENKFQSVFQKNKNLTVISASPDCKQYFLGFSNGAVHIIDAAKFQSSNIQLKFEQDWEDNSVTEIIFHKKLLFVAHKNGLINIFKKELIQQGQENYDPTIQNNQKYYKFQSSLKNSSQIDQLTVSENGKFLLGVQSVAPKLKNQNESLNLQNDENSSSDSDISQIVQDENDQLFKKQAVIYKIPLENFNSAPICKKFGEVNFEIKKLFIESKQKVLLISDTMDGIVFFSINDFEIEGHLKKMHQNIILDFMLLNDQNTLISTGKDKRIKIWDLQNQTLILMLPAQKLIYSTLGISQDQKYLVTGAKGQIVFWYINNWQKLCTLLLPIIENFNTSSLQFSQNDILLYAKNNQTNDVIYWQVSDTSLSLEFGNEKIVRALMTFDNKYLITESVNGTTILWSISRRSILQVITNNSGFQQEFNCTSDSKFIFFKIDDSQLVMFNLKEKKKEKIFHCNGEITYSCINSNNSIIFISTSNKILQIFQLGQKKRNEVETKRKNILNLLTKKKINQGQVQKDNNLIGEFVFKYKYDNVDDVEEQEFSPTFTLSADDNIVIISVNGKSTLILNVSDPTDPRILFKNHEEEIQNKGYFSLLNFKQDLKATQKVTQKVIQPFKNIKSFTIDHSGDQVILVDGKKASVLQLIDTENNNEKALVKDMIQFQNQNNSMQKGLNILHGMKSQDDSKFRYRFQQVQVLFKLSQEDDFHAYYVEKESLVLTKLNQQWSLWCTKNSDSWDRILEFEGEYQFMIGKNRILIGLIDINDQIKYISRKLLTELSGKSNDYIQKAIEQPETIKFLQEHLDSNSNGYSKNQQVAKYKNKLSSAASQITDLEKHHILKMGKIKSKQLILGDKNYEEKLDYDEQRRILKKLYPKKLKNDDKLTNRSHFKQTIKITGPLNYLYPFILSEMIKDQRNILNYIDALKRNSINPFEISILHYFTHQNQIHCMNACLEYKIKFNRDKFENTPLTYALKRKSLKAIEQILTHATDDNNTEIISTISQKEICQLIKQSPDHLVQFLEITYKEIQEEVPIFGLIKSQGVFSQVPFYFQEDRLLFDKKDADQYYQGSQRLKKQGLPIIMQALLFKYNFTLGSKESLKFHWALEQCKRQVFQCHSIQKIIQYKWQQFEIFAQIQFFIMMAYCIILILHLNHIDEQNYEIALVIFCVYFTAFQLVSIFSGDLSKMLQDFWSFFDLTFIILLIIYIILQMGFKSIISHQRYLMAILNLISWLRCVSLLRGFKSTRMFIKQLVQIMVDLKSFMVVLVISVFTVSTTFTMLTNSAISDDFQDQIDFVNYLYVVYEYVFQQFPAAYSPQYLIPVELPVNSSMSFPALFPLDNDMLFQLVLHFFAQIFISLIMMNLVIAIINETFVKSMENNKQEDFKELNNMIQFYEKLLFWRKNQGTAQYLHWLEYGDNLQEDEKVNEEESQLEKEVGEVNEKVDRIIEENSKVLQRIEKTEKYIIQLNETIQDIFGKKKNLNNKDTIESDFNSIGQAKARN